MELDQLAFKYQTDKGAQPTERLQGKNYTKYYTRIFNSMRNEVLNILEIGVHRGASLKMWQEYFPNSNIYGIDINKSCVKYNDNRIKVFIGNQLDVAFLTNVATLIKPIDIIIDDGGHTSDCNITAFNVLFSSLAPGGIYIIEDVWANANRPSLNEGKEITGKTFATKAIEIITHQDTLPIESIEFIRTNKHGALIVVRKRYGTLEEKA